MTLYMRCSREAMYMWERYSEAYAAPRLYGSVPAGVAEMYQQSGLLTEQALHCDTGHEKPVLSLPD